MTTSMDSEMKKENMEDSSCSSSIVLQDVLHDSASYSYTGLKLDSFSMDSGAKGTFKMKGYTACGGGEEQTYLLDGTWVRISESYLHLVGETVIYSKNKAVTEDPKKLSFEQSDQPGVACPNFMKPQFDLFVFSKTQTRPEDHYDLIQTMAHAFTVEFDAILVNASGSNELICHADEIKGLFGYYRDLTYLYKYDKQKQPYEKNISFEFP